MCNSSSNYSSSLVLLAFDELGCDFCLLMLGGGMPRPLHRGSSGCGGRLQSGGARSLPAGNGEQLDYDPQGKGYDVNGYEHEIAPATAAASRGRKNTAFFLFKLCLALILALAISCSLYWAIFISTTSGVNVHRSYRRLQEQLVADLSEIGELSLGVAKPKDLEFCPTELENYVPCYNASAALDSLDSYAGGVEYERHCTRQSAEDQGCLVMPPKDYRIPFRWPTSRDTIWKANVKITGQEFASGSLTKRMMVEEEHISFRSDSLMVSGVEDYVQQIAEMIGLGRESNFNAAGIRTVLDIGCGVGSYGAYLFSKQLLTMCIADYEISGSQVQLTLERGLPAMIASFISKQLPYPYLSFDMVHCAQCGVDWEKGDGSFLLEVNRLLRPGGYFVWTSTAIKQRPLRDKGDQKKWMFIHDFAETLCWDMLSQEDETVIWRKTRNRKCYSVRKSGPEICGKNQDVESPYYYPLHPCIGGTRSRRWISIESRTIWPSRVKLNSTELSLYGVHSEDFFEDSVKWNSAVQNYWSLLSPLIFSDHPKRPGTEEPSPPFNMLRNVLDMNAHFGGFNAALLDTGKTVWVMNVVPATSRNYLPLIVDRGLLGVRHDWCEAFPTYPRTYDMVHAEGLLSIETRQKRRCSLLSIFLEIDRILRPEAETNGQSCKSSMCLILSYSLYGKLTRNQTQGWVIIRDTAALIQSSRSIVMRLKWDVRMMEIDVNSDEQMLVCQKPFFKRQQ